LMRFASANTATIRPNHTRRVLVCCFTRDRRVGAA
jgi:hypothetical protein